MDILVLGGTGAIGTPLVTELSKRGNRVFVTTRKTRNDKDNIKYIHGDPHNEEFAKSLCSRKFDVIVDFMIYDLVYFKKILNVFLEATNQYVFISSSRVYANSNNRLTEESERLLDVIDDPTYLETNEYALKKAREENILKESDFKNWTIVRPYITYNSKRLQLGTLEKEFWLRRALHGKTVVLTKQTAEAKTSLTYGRDVSAGLIYIIGNKNVLGQIYHIVNEQTQSWQEILDLYNALFLEKEGRKFTCMILDDPGPLSQVLKNTYQMKYDRFYDRTFDSSKIKNLSCSEIKFTPAEIGLKQCLHEFLEDPTFNDHLINWAFEGYADRVCKETSPLSQIPGWKNKIKYLTWKWIPTPIMIIVKKIRHKN